MHKIIIPLSAFEVVYRGKRKYMTLNNWITVNRSKHGSSMGSKYKHTIQNRIKPIVLQAMIDGASLPQPAEFQLDWYFRDRRIDLDNWAFVHKFIFDAFQECTLREDRVFMANDNLAGITKLEDNFRGIDSINPRVEITWTKGE